MKAHLPDPDKVYYKISACMIAKNEEKNIAACIDSVKDFADEMIVVDTGSTDSTVKTATDRGARVGYFEWRNDFAAAKNCALDMAGGDWIVFLDADEYFNGGCGEKIREAIKIAEATGKNAIGCRMINLDTETGKEIVENFSVRIFKKGVRYRFAIHEEPSFQEGIQILSIEKDWFHLYHTGYSTALMPQKSKRNLDIMLVELGREESLIRRYTYYNYISDCYFTMKEYDKCIEYAKLYIEKSAELNINMLGNQITPYLNIIKCLEAIGDDMQLEYWIEEMARREPGYPDAAFARARLFMKQRKYKAALAGFQNALELSETYAGLNLNYIPANLAEIHTACGLCYEALLNKPDAISSYFKSFEVTNESVQPVFRLLSLVKGMPKEELGRFVESLYVKADIRRHTRVMTALMMNYMYDQLLTCYAAYKVRGNLDALDAQITAFLLASGNEYGKAGEIFLKVYEDRREPAVAVRCLICAELAGDGALLKEAGKIASAGSMRALGLGQGDFSPETAENYADIYTELCRMGHAEKALTLIGTLQGAGELFLLRLAECLENRCCFDGALKAAQLCPLTGRALMLRGYYAYRLDLPVYARDCFDAACGEAYEAPGFDELRWQLNDHILRLTGLQGDKADTSAAMIQGISESLESDPQRALELTRRYRLLDASNPEVNSAQCVLEYQAGRYDEAAVCALGSIERCGPNLELHYNASCIFERLSDKSRALSHLKAALALCRDGDTRRQLEEELTRLEST